MTIAELWRTIACVGDACLTSIYRRRDDNDYFVRLQIIVIPVIVLSNFIGGQCRNYKTVKWKIFNSIILINKYKCFIRFFIPKIFPSTFFIFTAIAILIILFTIYTKKKEKFLNWKFFTIKMNVHCLVKIFYFTAKKHLLVYLNLNIYIFK